MANGARAASGVAVGVGVATGVGVGTGVGVILLSDENQRVYAYAGEAYLNAAMLEKLGVSVTLLGDAATIETR